MQNLPKSRTEAKELGHRFYFNGSPCPYGHVAPRYTKNTHCKECIRITNKKYADRYRDGHIPEKARPGERSKALRSGKSIYFTGRPCVNGHVDYRYVKNYECVQCVRDRVSAWFRRNPDYIRPSQAPEQRREKYQSNSDYRRKQLKRFRKWAKKNKASLRAAKAKYRAAKRHRTPDWADLEAIKFFYDCCPDGCHVDHIIPLNGEMISGLHVETNLQWLPESQNLSKGNSFPI